MGYERKTKLLRGGMRGLGAFRDPRMRYLMTMGGIGLIPQNLNDAVVGALIYFDGEEIDGTFQVIASDGNEMRLQSHEADQKEVFNQIKKLAPDAVVSGAWIFIPLNVLGSKIRFWDEDFTGLTKEEVNPNDKEDIMWIQQLLYENNYNIEWEGIDGIMGPNTESALKEFQESVGIEQTGKIDSWTLNAISKSLVYSPAKTTASKPRTASKKEAKPAQKAKKKQSTKKLWRYAKWAGGIGLVVGVVAGGVNYVRKKRATTPSPFDFSF